MIIVLDVFFLYKSATFAIQFAIALVRIRHHEQIDWIERLEGISDPKREKDKLQKQLDSVAKLKWAEVKNQDQTPQTLYFADKRLFSNVKLPEIFQRILFIRAKNKTKSFLHQELELLKSFSDKKLVQPDEIRHVVIIPHVKEPVSILEETIEKIKNQTFPTTQISLVLAAEAVDPNGVKVSKKLKEKYKNYFDNIWITNHVLGDDEIVGKSSNMAWAGKAAVKEIKKLGWDLSKVTVTSCDADSKFPENYFAYLTYNYITIPDSKYKFFNGAMVLYNNIWRLPFYARVKNSMNTIYNVGRLVRTDKLVPFSTYTTSFWLVDQIGYWTPWITPEDFHLFFKALFKFNKKVECIPLYLKILSDSAEGDTHWETIRNTYKQERRWSWGISDDGWILKNIFTQWNKFSIRVKYLSFHVIWDHVIGSIGSLIILVGGNIPPLLNPEFRNTVFGVRLPGVASMIIQATLIFMIIVVILDFFLKPRTTKNSWWRRILRIFEWVVQPFAGFFLAIVPGLEAHTRLLFGSYLEYYVTKKKGKKSQ
jgi:hypothetical protein